MNDQKLDDLLTIPPFLDLSIPEVAERRRETTREYWSKVDRDERHKAMLAKRRVDQMREERDRLERERAERRQVRHNRKANRIERAGDRAVIIELLSRPNGPNTIGQLDKACSLDRKRIMSALRWLKKHNRITTTGRRYSSC